MFNSNIKKHAVFNFTTVFASHFLGIAKNAVLWRGDLKRLKQIDCSCIMKSIQLIFAKVRDHSDVLIGYYLFDNAKKSLVSKPVY